VRRNRNFGNRIRRKRLRERRSNQYSSRDMEGIDAVATLYAEISSSLDYLDMTLDKDNIIEKGIRVLEKCRRELVGLSEILRDHFDIDLDLTVPLGGQGSGRRMESRVKTFEALAEVEETLVRLRSDFVSQMDDRELKELVLERFDFILREIQDVMREVY